MITYIEIARAIQQVTTHLAEQRRVVLCPAALKDTVQGIVDREPSGYLFRVLGSSILDDCIVLVDPNMHTEYLDLWEEDHG